QEGRHDRLHRALRHRRRDPLPRLRHRQGRRGGRQRALQGAREDRGPLRGRAREAQGADRGGERHAMRARRATAGAALACAALAIALFVLVIYAGLAGNQTATANLVPTVIYVLFWVGIPVLSLLFGDVFRAINPWRAFARAVAWGARRVGGDSLPEPLPYPK